MDSKVFGVTLGILVGFFSALVYFFFILPQLLKMKGDLRISFSIFSKKDRKESYNLSETLEMMEENKVDSNENSKIDHSNSKIDDNYDESIEIKRVFRPLQILAACFGALSHGSNDVGNCIGELGPVQL